MAKTVVPVAIGTSEQETTKHKRPPKAPHGDGLLVSMFGLPGMTDSSVLKVPFYFQCPPIDDITRSYAYDWSTYNTLRRGEMLQASGKRLATVAFGTLFVDYTAAWTFQRKFGDVPDRSNNLNYPHPPQMARELLQIMHSGTPFGLTVAHNKLWGRADLHWSPKHGNAAVLTAIDVAERAGEIDARYVNVSFQEYRDPRIHRRKQGKGENRDPGRGRDLPVTLVIDKEGTAREQHGGDEEGHKMKDATLRKIARHYYGQQSLWRDLAKVNGIKNFSGDRNLAEYVTKRKNSSDHANDHGGGQVKVRVPKAVLRPTFGPDRLVLVGAD